STGEISGLVLGACQSEELLQSRAASAERRHHPSLVNNKSAHAMSARLVHVCGFAAALQLIAALRLKTG
ncbi:hypothetical protein J7E62_16120, partial [Variovorax paradoxus]|nr:hypothetical protein [Variovorax paradoxus]